MLQHFTITKTVQFFKRVDFFRSVEAGLIIKRVGKSACVSFTGAERR